jgi:predicted HicB family RNase H-like nuclease
MRFRLNLRIPLALYTEACKAAGRQGVTVNEWCRRAMQAALERERHGAGD